MKSMPERDAAAGLAKRIEDVLANNQTRLDEEKRKPDDRSPGFINAIMPDRPVSMEESAELDLTDWKLVAKALDHYAACKAA